MAPLTLEQAKEEWDDILESILEKRFLIPGHALVGSKLARLRSEVKVLPPRERAAFSEHVATQLEKLNADPQALKDKLSDRVPWGD